MASTTFPRCYVKMTAIVADVGTDTPAAQRRLSLPAVIPVSLNVTRAPYDIASTAAMTVEFDVLPLDPRMLRDIRVEVYAVASDDPAKPIQMLPANARFAGFVDFPEVTHDSGGSMVHLSARDYRGRLLDSTYTGGAVDLTATMTSIVYAVMAEVPGYGPPVNGEGFVVHAERDEPPATFYGKSRWTPPSGATVWDVLVGVAQTTGQTVWFGVSDLYVGNPRNAEETATFSVMFGDSVEGLSTRRNMNPAARRAVQVCATDPRNRTVTKGRWPAKERPGETVQAIGVTGGWTAAQCQASARLVYESQERAQIEGTIATIDPLDRNGKQLLDMQPGDKVLAYFKAPDRQHVLGKTSQQVADYMASAGIARTVAQQLATQYVNAKEFAPLYYARRVTWEFRRDAGFKFTLDVANVIDLGLV